MMLLLNDHTTFDSFSIIPYLNHNHVADNIAHRPHNIKMNSFTRLSADEIASFSSRPIHAGKHISLKCGCFIIEAANGRMKDQLILLYDMTVCGKPNSRTLMLSHREHDNIRLTFRHSGEAGIWLTASGKCTGWLLEDLYTDIGYIDSGGNGNVYSATQRETGIRVAVKVFKHDPDRNMRELRYSWKLRLKNFMCAVDILLARDYVVRLILVIPPMDPHPIPILKRYAYLGLSIVDAVDQKKHRKVTVFM